MTAHPPQANNARYFLCVKYDTSTNQWKYDNDSAYYAFTPAESDILIAALQTAALNFDTDTATSLAGQNSTEYGIAKGYRSGSLTITANRYGGASNTGEFELGGTSLVPNRGILARKYYNGVAMRENGTLYWLFSDHLGSTSLLADTAGNKISELRFKPWGEVRYGQGRTPTGIRYTGQRAAPELGLQFFKARWYDSSLGRFAQADTVVPDPGSSISWDRHAAMGNNPLRFVDPSGHHYCDSPNADPEECKDYVPKTPDPVKLTKDQELGGKFDGTMIYQLYLKYKETTNSWWYDEFGNDADGFSVTDFFTVMMYYEIAGDTEHQNEFIYATSEKYSHWCAEYSPGGTCGGASDNATLNYLSTRQVARDRYNQMWTTDGIGDFKSKTSDGKIYRPQVWDLDISKNVSVDALNDISPKGDLPMPDWGNKPSGELYFINMDYYQPPIPLIIPQIIHPYSY